MFRGGALFTPSPNIRSLRSKAPQPQVTQPMPHDETKVLSPAVMVLIFMAALLFCFSIIPGITRNETIAAYAWRGASLLLIVAVATVRQRISLSSSYLLFSLGYLLLIFFLPLMRAQDSADLLVKNVVLVGMVAAIVPTHAEDPAQQVIASFLRQTLILSTLASVVLSIGMFMQGWDWETARILKFEAQRVVPYNISLFLMAICMMLVRFNQRWVKPVLVVIFIALGFASTTRTPGLALVMAWGVAMLGWASFKRIKHSALPFAIVIICFVVMFTYWTAGSQNAELNRFLAGRQALWIAGIGQWQESMLFGNPNTSLADAITQAYSDLSFQYDWEFGALTELHSGGYHNIGIQLLATMGLFGLFTAVLGYVTLITRASRAATPALLIVILVLILRGVFEVGGMLYSSASTPLELVTHIIVGLVLARPKDITDTVAPCGATRRYRAPAL